MVTKYHRLWIKHQKCIVSHFWRSKVQDQSVGRFGFSWRLSPCLQMASFSLSSHDLFFVRACPWFLSLFSLCKNLISKYTHILRYWLLGLQHRNLEGGHNQLIRPLSTYWCILDYLTIRLELEPVVSVSVFPTGLESIWGQDIVWFNPVSSSSSNKLVLYIFMNISNITADCHWCSLAIATWKTLHILFLFN